MNYIWSVQKELEQLFAEKDKKVLGGWNYEVRWKLAENKQNKMMNVLLIIKYIIKKLFSSSVCYVRFRDMG